MKIHKVKKRSYFPNRNKQGFTLLELVVVIIIMGVLSLVAIRGFSNQTAVRLYEQTKIEMDSLKKAIVGDADRIQDGVRVDFGYVGDMGAVPTGSNATGLGKLKTDPLIGGNWNGPYVGASFSDNPDGYLTDAYGQGYEYNPTALTIYSPGADITLTFASDINNLTNKTITLLIKDVDGDPIPADTSSFTIVLTLQTSSVVGTATGAVVPASGFVQLTGIPMGSHTLVVSYPGLPSVIKRVVVDPSFALPPINVIFSFP